MTHSILDFLRNAVVHYGYWAVAVALLIENAGVPAPGETMLLLASFLAYSEHELSLPWIIVVATIAATVGDNLGYALGCYGGRRLLHRYQRVFRIQHEKVAHGENLFARYGAVTILLARFIFGLRIIAGPLAGVLRMPWRKFLIFNFLGAGIWVTVISSAGYWFGQHFNQHFDRHCDGHFGRLERNIQRVDALAAAVVLLGMALWWWRSQRRD